MAPSVGRTKTNGCDGGAGTAHSSATSTGQLFLELWWSPADPSSLHQGPQNHSLASEIIIELHFCRNLFQPRDKRIQCGQN
jgi:hypothetical protein